MQLSSIPEEDRLYQCDYCFTYYMFSDIVFKERDKIEFVLKHVKFKTRKAEKEFLKKREEEKKEELK